MQSSSREDAVVCYTLDPDLVSLREVGIPVPGRSRSKDSERVTSLMHILSYRCLVACCVVSIHLPPDGDAAQLMTMRHQTRSVRENSWQLVRAARCASAQPRRWLTSPRTGLTAARYAGSRSTAAGRWA